MESLENEVQSNSLPEDVFGHYILSLENKINTSKKNIKDSVGPRNMLKAVVLISAALSIILTIALSFSPLLICAIACCLVSIGAISSFDNNDALRRQNILSYQKEISVLEEYKKRMTKARLSFSLLEIDFDPKYKQNVEKHLKAIYSKENDNFDEFASIRDKEKSKEDLEHVIIKMEEDVINSKRSLKSTPASSFKDHFKGEVLNPTNQGDPLSHLDRPPSARRGINQRKSYAMWISKPYIPDELTSEHQKK